jgi:hypothetical protein
MLRPLGIQLGQHVSHQFIVFEHKRLFSIVFYYFPRQNRWQDRLHSHAFNALSVRVFGDYTEAVANVPSVPQNVAISSRRNRGRFFRIPAGRVHGIGPSEGCLVMVLTGPWSPTWKEYKDGKVRELGWGRKVIDV